MGFSVSTTKFVFFGLILVPSVQMVRGCGPNDNMPSQPLNISDIRGSDFESDTGYDDYFSDGLEDEKAAQELDPQTPMPYELHPQPGENIGHYVLWTGLTKDELMDQMGLTSPRGLRADRSYSLLLSPLDIAKFEQSRQSRIKRLREDFFSEYKVKDYTSYTVERGDSPDRISNRVKVPLWLVVEANRGIELGRIHPGDVIQLPVVVPRSEEKEELEEQAKKPEPKPVTKRKVVAVKKERKVKSETTGGIDFAKNLGNLVVARKNPGLKISVMPGESLSYIAGLAKVSVPELIRINKIEHPDRIKVGHQLRLPIPTEDWARVLKARKERGLRSEAVNSYRRRGFEIRLVKIRSGDTLSALTQSLGADKGALKILNPSLNLDRISPGDKIRFAIRPVQTDTQPQPPEGT